MRTLLLLGLALLPQDGEGSPVPPSEPAPQRAARAVLARDPRSLPRAPEGRWDGWSPDQPADAELARAQQRIAQASARDDLPAALEELYAALELAPDWPPALHQLGVLYFRLQRYGDAAAAFGRFVEVAPQLVGQTRGLGHALYSLGEWERARDHYARVLEALPSDADARFGLALCRMRLGDHERALEGLDQVLAADPEHAEAAIWRAQLLFDAGRSSEALEGAERARDLDPFEARPWFLLARVLFDLGRDEEAEAAHGRFEELDRVAQEARRLENDLEYAPADLGRLARLAELRAGVGDHERARRALARMLLVAPRDLELRLWQLDLLEAVGDETGARVAAEALEQALPDEARAWERLARFWGRRGDRGRQVRAGERYLRLSGAQPEDGSARRIGAEGERPPR